MEWKEILIHTENEALEAISNLLNEKGANGVIIEDPLELKKDKPKYFGEIYDLNTDKYPEEGIYIKGYFPNNSNFNELFTEIKQAVLALDEFGLNIGKANFKTREFREEDWAHSWKQYYKPTPISDKIVVVPEWDQSYEADDEAIILKLDPGMAFGTGTHPTTQLSVKALEKVVKNGDKVLDVGCGSGVLSIASALLGAKEVWAYDLDEVAVNSTELNASLNGQENVIKAKQNNLLEGVEIKADVIVANILAEIIVKMLPDAATLLKTKGKIILSGIIKKNAKIVETALINNDFEVLEIQYDKEWVMIIAEKQ